MLEREGYVGVKDAAAILDVAPNTIRAWGASGKIGEYRHPVNNYRLYKRKELERLIQKLNRSLAPASGGGAGKKGRTSKLRRGSAGHIGLGRESSSGHSMTEAS